jgi:hypothetical protein
VTGVHLVPPTELRPGPRDGRLRTVLRFALVVINETETPSSFGTASTGIVHRRHASGVL